MAYTFQVAVDCQEPHVLADWWADALGWNVEPQDDRFIRRMIAEGHASEAATTTHRGELVWKDGAAIRAPAGLEAAPRTPVPRARAGGSRGGTPRATSSASRPNGEPAARQPQASTSPPWPSGWNSGMAPKVRTFAASSLRADFQPPPSVLSVPMTTGSASMRRTSRRADASDP